MANPNRLLRLPDVLEILPISRSTWWQGIKDGKYPKGILISARVRAWPESEILALVEDLKSSALAKTTQAGRAAS